MPFLLTDCPYYTLVLLYLKSTLDIIEARNPLKLHADQQRQISAKQQNQLKERKIQLLKNAFFSFILLCAPKRKVAALFDLRRLQRIDEWNKTVSLPVMRQNVSFFPIIFSVRLL